MVKAVRHVLPVYDRGGKDEQKRRRKKRKRKDALADIPEECVTLSGLESEHECSPKTGKAVLAIANSLLESSIMPRVRRASLEEQLATAALLPTNAFCFLLRR